MTDDAKRAFQSLAPGQRLGDAPIEDKYHRMMQVVAAALDEWFNGDTKGQDRATGFVLMVFPFGNRDGRCNYISNGASRDDVVVLMKEMIRRFEGGADVPPGRA